MTSVAKRVEKVTIKAGQTTSSAVTLADVTDIGMVLPGALSGTKYIFEVAGEAAGPFTTLYVGTSPWTLVYLNNPLYFGRAVPLLGENNQILIRWKYARLVSDTAEAADRVFEFHLSTI